MNKQSVQIPWSAFLGERTLQIDFPSQWQVDVFHFREENPVSYDQIQKETEKLIRLITEKNPANIAFAVDDLTRPLSYSDFFDAFLYQLNGLHYKPKITVIIGLGTHRSLSQSEIAVKIGENIIRYGNILIKNHDYRNDVVPTGIEWGKIPLQLNKYFLEADFRVVLSTIIPHPFAGFSGGAKMLVPGLSNIEITRRTHQMALMGFAGKIGDVRNNKLRKILDDFAAKIRVDYFLGFLTDGYRHCVRILGGDLEPTYYRICEMGASLYSVPAPAKKYDLIWLNAYPKDSELLQIETAFIPVNSAREKFWHDDTVFVVSAACGKGLGGHDLFGPGGLLYRPPKEKRNLKGNPVYFYLPEIKPEEFKKVFWEGYRLFNSKEELIAELETMSSSRSKSLAVFPYASIQMIK